MEERRAAFGRLAAIVVLEGGLARRPEARSQLPAAVDLLGLGMKLNGHQAEAFGTAQIETTPGDAEAVFGLAAEEFGGDHTCWTKHRRDRFKYIMQSGRIGFAVQRQSVQK